MDTPEHTPFSDAHIHLNYLSNDAAFAAQAGQAGCFLFANGVRPGTFEADCQRYAAYRGVMVGCGMHPWFVSEESMSADLAAMEAGIHASRFVGEVGLDAGRRGADALVAQMHAFQHIARWCAREQNRIVSIHAIKTADAALDTLEETGALQTCTCIFHWFSGSCEQLHRAVADGCWFSVGPFMAQSKRGREYLKLIPADRLLLETDAPPGGPHVEFTFEEHQRWLGETAQIIAQVRGREVAAQANENTRALLSQATA